VGEERRPERVAVAPSLGGLVAAVHHIDAVRILSVRSRREVDRMAMVIDPVCGMRIDTEDAAATLEHDGTTYYFCSEACREAFVADPTAYGREVAEEDRIPEAELAERAGTSIDHIRGLVELGLLRPEGGTFLRRDVMRARVIVELEAKGLDVGTLGAAVTSGHLTLGYLESAGRRFPRSDRTFLELGEELDVPFEMLQTLYVVFGLPRPDPEERVREEDLPILKALPVLFGAGLGEGEVLRALRVWGESARRVAQFQTHYFHHTIEEPFRRRGLRDNEAFETALREVGFRVGHSGEEMLGWLFRRHSEAFLAEHQFDHVEAALEEAGIRPRTPRGAEASVFADLTGYTALTEEAGDRAAAAVALALARLVTEVAARHRGDVVKMLGDGVHFHFRDPADAIRASLDMVDSVRPRGLPPAHIGVNAGPMIYDEGDYFGRTVNIAARIAGQARPDQVLVGEDARREVTQDGFVLVEAGTLDLKGISDPVAVYEARTAGPGA
jgi:adenylate cyclase